MEMYWRWSLFQLSPLFSRSIHWPCVFLNSFHSSERRILFCCRRRNFCVRFPIWAPAHAHANGPMCVCGAGAQHTNWRRRRRRDRVHAGEGSQIGLWLWHSRESPGQHRRPPPPTHSGGIFISLGMRNIYWFPSIDRPKLFTDIYKYMERALCGILGAWFASEWAQLLANCARFSQQTQPAVTQRNSFAANFTSRFESISVAIILKQINRWEVAVG